VVAFPAKRARKTQADKDALARLLKALDDKVINTHQTRRPNCTVARGTLQRLLDQEGEEHLTMLIRTIVESKGNARALIDPVIMAVNAVMLAYPAWPQTGLAWIEAFDELDLMRMHDMVRPLKPQDPARSTIAGMLVQRLHPVFCPPKVKPPKKVYEPKKPPNGARIAIEQGMFLLQHKGPHANSPISHIAYERFKLSPGECCQVINAARLCGDRQDLVARLSREALFRLSAPIMPDDVRQAIERRLAAGERLGGPEIERMRTGALTARNGGAI
jgi:hypothetical protein